MNPTDLSQFLDVFLDEGREQLAALESNVLEMERGRHGPDTMQTLFRAAHTIKGSSRAMGFLAIGDLTHEMENVLDALRNDEITVTTPLVNALLECVDALTLLIESVASHGSDRETGGKDIPALVARLSVLNKASADPEPSFDPNSSAARGLGQVIFPLADHVQATIESAVETGLKIFHLTVTLDADCQMKSIRAWMVMGALEPFGTILAAYPEEDQLEAEEFEQSFELIFAAEQDILEAEAALNAISEIESVVFAPWQVQKLEQTPKETPDAAVEPRASEAPAAVFHAQTIRVDVSRLDTLLNLVGELVIERAQITRIGGDLNRRFPKDEGVEQLLEATHHIARVSAELQGQLMKARMLPIDGVFQRMPRMMRDLAQKTEKNILFEMTGGETELDRSVLESLSDPLIHLLRNSADHGIETPLERIQAGKPEQGRVSLSARHEDNHIVIQVEDDGRGIHPEKIKASAVRKGLLPSAMASAMSDRDALNLIFASGFSTAETISDISGRGVGMDIVKSNIEKMGGRIVVDSIPNQGSRMTIHLPLTLAIVRAVLVSAGGGTYVLPLGSVVEMLALDSEETARRVVGGQSVISLRGRTIPLANLADLLNGDSAAFLPERIAEDAFVVVAGIGERQIGLCVDGLDGEQEVVIKSLGTLLGGLTGVSGATILGDGRVALIVDVSQALDSLTLDSPRRETGLAVA